VKRVQLEKLTARRLGELSASRDAGCRKMRRGVDGFNSGLRAGAQAGRRFVDIQTGGTEGARKE
jgi:hypothetical protein